MNNRLRLLTGAMLTMALGLTTGCPGDDSASDDSTSSTTNATASGSSGPGMTSVATTEVSDSGDTGPVTATTATTVDPTTGSPCPNDGALGDACSDACGCMSEACFVVGPLGGVCSECEGDADCADTTGFGCNFGNPLAGQPAVCSPDGTLGEGCETADACATDLFCPTLIEVPGILGAATCSECETDADCMGPMSGGPLCVPTYDIEAIGGFYQCVSPNSIPDDEGCNLLGDGSECMSGQCAPASIMMIPVLGVCSPCNEDSDCMGTETCVLPEIAIEGTSLALVPGQCM